ncbi:hypothetical protein DPMN_101286 [Dreissena polymorpha]|uniref:Uncharacterized protein n=1 Tax=Dreissena polymorpha TaxID=45954 RepID=A0A9D4R873_DREPO|nr:hypothetical protein DPMN_101286 [Dreissena polymorpha]
MQTRPTLIDFVKERSAPRSNGYTNSGILASARDWERMVDLMKKLRFPAGPEKISLIPGTCHPDMLNRS